MKSFMNNPTLPLFGTKSCSFIFVRRFLETLLKLATVCLALVSVAHAQTQPRGLIQNDEVAFFGYTLFSPLRSKMTHLIDMDGRVVHDWESEHAPANSAYLLANGNLLRPSKVLGNKVFGSRGPSGGRVELFDWDGNRLWNFVYSNEWHHQHHDVEPLPNGNVLILAWERKTSADVIAAGRTPRATPGNGLFPDIIVEVKRTGPTSGDIIWEWHAWDHLVQDFDQKKANYGDIAAHPELFDVNLNGRPRSDWMHSNGMDYNPELDQIVISSRSFNEFFVIDHSTTTEEAAGHTGGRAGRGGDILYRWGNPVNYRAGGADDQKLFYQHDARWVRAGFRGQGNITVFNNVHRGSDGEWSSVDEIAPPINGNGSYRFVSGSAFEPSDFVWTYSASMKSDFFSSFISGAERLQNGNTLICSGAEGIFFEVTADGKTVWEYRNPFEEPPRGPEGPYSVFRVVRYAPDFPGLVGRNLEPELK